MNTNKHRNLTKLALALVALITPAALQAGTFNFHVFMDVSSLNGAPNSPFFLDFQLNQGSGTLTNSVSVDDFQFLGGTPSGSPSTFGLASGDLGSTVTLTDTTASPFNELFQGFTSSTTKIQFDVQLSQNVPGVTPDGFLVSILDSEPNNPQIATTDAINSSMITVPISNANTIGDAQTFTSTSPAGVTASVVPEPSAMAALLGGVGCLLALRRRRAQVVA